MDPSVIRVPLTIPVYPHFMDHRFNAKVVFPAVEALKVLGAAVMKTDLKEIQSIPWTMVDARFNKFLYIEPGKKSIQAFCDIRPMEDTRILATLITRTAIKNRTMTRVKEHCRVGFSLGPDRTQPPPFRNVDGLHGPVFRVSADRLYQELVPFGPAFHSITGELKLYPSGAVAGLAAGPDHPDDPLKAVLGSGFPLDGAFHAGCVWSQRFHNIVAFPVGFDKRIIHKRTLENNVYAARVIPRYQAAGTLGFDIWIVDNMGDLCETILGVMMRDVSGGAITPPDWIRETPL